MGTDYEVGPGLKYTTLGAVPWETLGPGDSVRIHAIPGGYHEAVLVSTRGTAADPILVCGIPDMSSGSPVLPIIDGENATTRPELVFGPNSGIEALFTVYNNNAASPGGMRPGYITIANLQFQNAAGTSAYTNTSGQTRHFEHGAAGVGIFFADNVVLSGNVLTDDDQGLFVFSQDFTNSMGYDYGQSRTILVQGNSFTNNGIPGNTLVHNAYTEAIGIVFEYNYFGRLKDYAEGNAIADRSVGTVVRYNFIDGGGHQIALENPQTSWKNVQPNLAADPSLGLTFVYGNVLIDRRNPGVDTTENAPESMYNGYASRVVLYGGTDDNYPSYRNGTLFFNTVVIQADDTNNYNTALFEVYCDPSTPLLAKVVAENNIFYSAPETPGKAGTNLYLSLSTNKVFGPGNVGLGDLTFDTNWIDGAWQATYPANMYYDTSMESIKTMGFVTGSTGTGPGFVDVAKQDFHITDGSPAVDKGIALPAAAQGSYQVQYEYVGPNQSKPRDLHGTPIDLGAFEAP
jgi:hypothetical protein